MQNNNLLFDVLLQAAIRMLNIMKTMLIAPNHNKKHIQNTDALLIAFASIVANVIAAVVFAAAASAAGTAAAITVTHAVPSHVFVADRIGVIQTCTMLCLCLCWWM